MISPYHFYFVFVPREASNLSEVRFGDVAVLKQFSVLHRKNSWKFSIYILDLLFLVHMPQVISKLSLVWTLFDLSNRKPSKNSTFVSCSVFIDFCQYLCLPLYRFLFEFFWSRNFWGSCYSSICFICGDFELKPEAKKGLIRCYAYANVANRFVFSFCMKEVFKCRDRRMMRWVEEWTKARSWGCPAPQEISKKYKRQSLGMPPRHPFFISKNQVTFQRTIFLLLHALCIFLGASVVFKFCLVLFATINSWTPTNFFWRSCPVFHLPRTLCFSFL
jgi:hypothetical protein